MSNSVEIIENIDGLYSLQKEWDELYSHCYNKENVFLSFEWIKLWTEISTQKIFILVVRNQIGKAIVIAPLAIRIKKKMGMNYKILSFLASGPTDYHGFIASEINDELSNLILVAIKERSNDWDIIELKEFSQNDIIGDYLLKSDVFNFIKTINGPCPKIVIADNEQFKDKVAKKIEQDVTYQIRRLKKGGVLEFKTITKLSDLDRFMTDFFETHQLRWNKTKTPSKFNDKEGQLTFRKLAERMFKNGTSSYHYLTYNNEVIAINLGFRSENTYFYYLVFERKLLIINKSIRYSKINV